MFGDHTAERSFQPTTNVVSGNVFQQETSRANKGCAVEEQNDGFNRVQNVYIGKQISANYLPRPIRTLRVDHRPRRSWATAAAARIRSSSAGL